MFSEKEMHPGKSFKRFYFALDSDFRCVVNLSKIKVTTIMDLRIVDWMEFWGFGAGPGLD